MNSRLCDWCQQKGLDCWIAAGSQAKTCLVCKKHHTLCVQGGKLMTGQKRKQAATVVILEESLVVEEEAMVMVLVQRKVLDKSFFEFELEDGKMTLLPSNPFWNFWHWSWALEKQLEELEEKVMVLEKMVKGKEKGKEKE